MNNNIYKKSEKDGLSGKILNQHHHDIMLQISKPSADIADRKKSQIGCAVTFLITGLFVLILGILTLRFEFLELALNERIKMRPGLPPYEKWKNPTSYQLGVNVYLFAIKNADAFLNGTDKVLRFEEIGPIAYTKKMRQEDVIIHEEDSTLSYTTAYDLEYLEHEHDPGFLNKSITIVNPMLLGLAAHIHDQFIAKFAFELLAAKDHVFIERTIYEILWNCTSPMFDFFKQIPFIVPRSNLGVMFNSFYPAVTRYNVNIGTKHGYEKFFTINTLNGENKINIYEDDFPEHCPYSLKGAREGTGMPPLITKDTVLYTYQNNLCRTYPLIYNRTLKYRDTIEAYEFIFSNDIYKRNKDPKLDCLKRTASVQLPDGLIDSSRCAFGMPVSLSNPHFYGYRGKWEDYLEGLNPNTKDHSSYLIIEPTTGIQLEAVARIQSNIPLPPLETYSKDIRLFSNMIIPTFWLEMVAKNKDPATMLLIQVVNSLPIVQPIIIVILFTLSAFCIFKGIVLLTALNLKFRARSGKEKTIVYHCREVCEKP